LLQWLHRNIYLFSGESGTHLVTAVAENERIVVVPQHVRG
jgi:hypothetical protein